MYAYNIKETQTALGDLTKYGALSMFDAIYCILLFSTFTPKRDFFKAFIILH